jgi:hypothetical protein
MVWGQNMNNKGVLKIAVTMSYLAMILFNIASIISPTSGRTAAEIADSYPNLFVPAQYTFVIWILIYGLLSAFVLYQADIWNKGYNKPVQEMINQTRGTTIGINVLSIGWIIAWQKDYLALSFVIAAILLIGLSHYFKYIRTEYLTLKEKFFVILPFRIYFSWITVFVLGNLIILLVSIKFTLFGITDVMITVATLLILMGFSTYRIIRYGDYIFGATTIWSLFGIVGKHLLPSRYHVQYPQIIVVALVGILLLIGACIYVWFYRKKRICK